LGDFSQGLSCHWFILFILFANIKKKWFVPRLRIRNKEYLWNGLMNFSEILPFSSRDKKKSPKKSVKFIEPLRSGQGWGKNLKLTFFFVSKYCRKPHSQRDSSKIILIL
jgi:hypothetical protein